MRPNRKLLYCLFFLISGLSACDVKLGKNEITEGIIRYKIDYLQEETENPIISLMPSHLDMIFKDNSVMMEAEGYLGLFKTSFIKQSDKLQTVTVIKMMNKKYYVLNDKNSDFMGMNAFDSIEVAFDDQIKRILTYDCSHCLVTVPKKNLSFDVFYTQQIKIDNPNAKTPFHSIPGVMLQFQIEANGIPMHLTASEFIESEITEKMFDIPSGYQQVTQDTIDNLFLELI